MFVGLVGLVVWLFVCVLIYLNRDNDDQTAELFSDVHPKQTKQTGSPLT